MDDRKLLELAAKAAGYSVDEPSYEGVWVHPAGASLNSDNEPDGLVNWRPLTDNGDALWLAAHLRLKVLPGKHKGDGCSVEAQVPGVAGCTAFRDDPAEQMRRAIVHVAAEIGASL